MIIRAVRRILRPLKAVGQAAGAMNRYLQRYGVRRLLLKVVARLTGSAGAPKLRRLYDAISYSRWIGQNERKHRAPLQPGHTPKISLVVPCHETPLVFLRQLVESIQRQSYSNWQLCLAGQLPAEGGTYIKKVVAADPRIEIIRLEGNLGISGNTNAALDQSVGEYVGFIDHDDTLAPFALEEVVRLIQEFPTADFIYSDEDKITRDGRRRHTPHFKPNWSPDLLRSYNYITHFVVLKKSLLDQIGQLRSEYDSAQDYDLVLRAGEAAATIKHIPQVLYHWREHAGSTSINIAAKPVAAEMAVKVVKDHLHRIDRPGSCTAGPFFGAVQTEYELVDQPLVSIIIPSHDHAADLATCLASIKEKTTYRHYEVVIMENHSREKATFDLYRQLEDPRVRVIEWGKPFNYSAINNDGVTEAKGSVVVFLNNDVSIISPDWIEQMLMHLQFADNGIVGAKLYYEDGSIQHAGVILGIGGIAGHSHKNFPHNDPGYFGRLSVVQNLSAVTGACLMVKKDIFERVGGFETNLPIAFNDIDLCLKIDQIGQRIVWTPAAELFHYESKTRGYEDTFEKQQRFLGEIDYFQRKWSDKLSCGDPYYSPNLTLAAEDFSINA